jgi:D-3-phosphoglycerate dehydrogenase
MANADRTEDSNALARALDAEKIAGCALDTTDRSRCPIRTAARPREGHHHVAWYSEQAVVGLQAGAPSEVHRVLAGEWPINVVNRAVRGRNRAAL